MVTVDASAQASAANALDVIFPGFSCTKCQYQGRLPMSARQPSSKLAKSTFWQLYPSSRKGPFIGIVAGQSVSA